MKRRSIAMCLASVLSPCHSEVTLDGTMGPAGPLSGPDFQIRANLGRQKDSNLFHSFGAFNINHSESATSLTEVKLRKVKVVYDVYSIALLPVL